MTDKQIDINNQVEVGLNIAKELLELHKMFEDEVEKSPYFIQTNFIKNKLFYFYQRADWLNVCFNLLDKQLKAKEQECEFSNLRIIQLQETLSQYETDLSTKDCIVETCKAQYKELKAENDNIKETFDGLFKVQYKLADNNKKLRQCLIEIKEIAEKNLNIHTCAFKGCGYDLITKQILQKISEVEE